MSGGRFPARAAAIALLVGALVAGSATAAGAATDPIGLSDDGTNFSSTYPGSLFTDVVLVPGGSATRSFWVKNQESGYGYLAIALDDVASVDPDFTSALTIRASSGAANGQAVAFSAAAPCIAILQGILLSASEAVRVDVTVALSDALTGTQSQQSIADFDLRVALTSADATASDGCSPAVPPAPEPPGGGSTTPGGGGGASIVLPGTGGGPGTGVPTFSPTPKPTEPEPEAGGDGTDVGVFGNTDRFYQEYFVAWWIVALLLGCGWAWFRDRRRERISE